MGIVSRVLASIGQSEMRKINLARIRVGAGVRPTSKAGEKPRSAKVSFKTNADSEHSTKNGSGSTTKIPVERKGTN